MDEYLDKRKGMAKFGLQQWAKIEEDRRRQATPLELTDKTGRPFWFVLSSDLLTLVSEIERSWGFLASLQLPKKLSDRLSSDNEKREAYYSSHIEGAVTSMEEAMRHLNKPSRENYEDESLQMIVNNRDALEFIRAQRTKPFSHGLICDLQNILVRNTHKQHPITVGAYRLGPIYVVDGQGQVVYEGPPASAASVMMESYVRWLNAETGLHPLIKAALVHLYFIHVHPFDDGNGRSARALSNLYLMKRDYQFINFLAPSDYFDHHRGDYYQAIRNAETHGSDATFFILYYLKALADQLKKVQAEIQLENKVKDVVELLSAKVQAQLDKKQMKALQWMLENPNAMTTKKYCKLGRCSDETARKDFNRLMEMGLIEQIGHGRATGYILKSKGQ